ncbi:MAG: hypothetical protein M0Q91_15185 [Methanoregula sp.]|jgi:hypothetical protein|nr:hypothetical protein [Methanoregula sp.]
MQEFSIQKDGKFLTGNISAGRYEFTANREFRYIFELERANQIAGQFEGSVIVKE